MNRSTAVMTNLFGESKVEMLPTPVAGTVELTLAPNQIGRVKCEGSYWPARFLQSDCTTVIQPEQPVKVIAMQGITLLVQPAS